MYRNSVCRFLILRDISELDETIKKLDAQQKFAILGEASSSITHEIANPVALIDANVEFLLKAIETGKNTPEMMEAKLRSCLRSSRYIGSILYSFRNIIRSDRHKVSAWNLEAIVDDCIAIAGIKAKANFIQIEKTADSDIVLEGNASEVMQAVINLLSNAIDATKAANGNTLTVTVGKTDHGFVVRVTDPGVITDPKVRAHLFDSFWSGKEEGMGVGLYLSRNLVDRMGGRLYLDESCPTTSMVIELPRKLSTKAQ